LLSLMNRNALPQGLVSWRDGSGWIEAMTVARSRANMRCGWLHGQPHLLHRAL
jgi:hypothetical protein